MSNAPEIFEDLVGELPDAKPTEKAAKRDSAGDVKGILTPTEIEFVNALLDGHTQATAYQIANPDYTGKWADSLGYSLANHPRIVAVVAEAMAKRRKMVANHGSKNVTRLLDEHMRIAFFDPKKLFDNTGRPLPIEAIDRDTRAAIVGLEVVDEFEGRGEARQQIGTIKKYKIADKQKALDSLSKILGLLVERSELTGKDGKDLVPEALDVQQVATRLAFLLHKAGSKAE